MLKKYPDGSSYACADLEEEFTFRINTYGDLWHLHQSIDASNNIGIIPTVTIPCIIDQQADRRFNSNESFGLKLVCKFLNSMNAKFKIFHPHNPEVIEALMDNVEIIDNSKFIEQVWLDIPASKVKGKITKDHLILMSSDAGGFKPLMKICDKIDWRGETFSASKSRKYEEGKSKLIQQIDKQDFEGKDILIIDDICIYGGTFKGLSKLLKEKNCGKLYLAVSHMTVQFLGEDPVTNYFDKVFTTNSKFDRYESAMWTDLSTRGNRNLEIIKLF